VAYRPHNWAVSAAHCWLKAIGNGDEHRTLGSQRCERAMLTIGTLQFSTIDSTAGVISCAFHMYLKRTGPICLTSIVNNCWKRSQNDIILQATTCSNQTYATEGVLGVCHSLQSIHAHLSYCFNNVNRTQKLLHSMAGNVQNFKQITF